MRARHYSSSLSPPSPPMLLPCRSPSPGIGTPGVQEAAHGPGGRRGVFRERPDGPDVGAITTHFPTVVPLFERLMRLTEEREKMLDESEQW